MTKKTIHSESPVTTKECNTVNIASGRGPDFLLIGAARSGTTWLHQRLKRHRNIFVTPVKEIHYFDIYRKYPVWHWIRLRRMLLHFRRYCGYLSDRSGRNTENMTWLLKWGLNYFLMPKTHAWYRSLFRDQHQRIAGELTPAYAILEEVEIAEVMSINPGTRIIFQMRDPIDRAWSQAVMHLGLHRRPGSFDQYLDEIRAVIFKDEIIKRSMYLETIDKWEKYVDRENICYLFFDDIQLQPASLLSELFNFLGVETGSENDCDQNLEVKVAGRDTGGREIPPEVEVELARVFLPMLTALASRFDGGYPKIWETRARRLLESG